jgi:hypothetical protein
MVNPVGGGTDKDGLAIAAQPVDLLQELGRGFLADRVVVHDPWRTDRIDFIDKDQARLFGSRFGENLGQPGRPTSRIHICLQSLVEGETKLRPPSVLRVLGDLSFAAARRANNKPGDSHEEFAG